MKKPCLELFTSCGTPELSNLGVLFDDDSFENVGKSKELDPFSVSQTSMHKWIIWELVEVHVLTPYVWGGTRHSACLQVPS